MSRNKQAVCFALVSVLVFGFFMGFVVGIKSEEEAFKNNMLRYTESYYEQEQNNHMIILCNGYKINAEESNIYVPSMNKICGPYYIDGWTIVYGDEQ